MPDDPSQQADDFWSVLDEAELTVDAWASWQKKYDVDIFYEGYEVETRPGNDDT